MRLYNIMRTTCACPSQWQGVTEDERPVYMRYRGGLFEIRIGPIGGDVGEAVRADSVYECDVGGGFDGYMTCDDMFRHWLKYADGEEK